MRKLALDSSGIRRRASLFQYLAASMVLVSLTVHLRWWTGFDLGAMVFLEDLTPHSFDSVLSVFSLLGSAEVTGLIILAFALFFCPPSSRILLIVSFGLTAVFEWIGKHLVYQPGPPDIYYRYILPFGLPISFPSSGVETPFSFPSGHSARTVFISLVLGWWIWRSHTGKMGRWLLVGILSFGETVMLVSRVTLGEHWPSDVIGGALMATLLVLAWWYSTDKIWFAREGQMVQQSNSK